MTDGSFHPTRWTLVLRAAGDGTEAGQALSDLCAAYYAPVVAFLRRWGRDEDSARDLAHAFFAGLLADGVGAPDPARGRFRSYLLGALKHFVSKQKQAALAQKRGAGAEHVSLVAENDTSPGTPEPADPNEEDHAATFDREWAFTLIARALAALEKENASRPAQFAALRPWLDGHADGASQTLAARELGMNETALRVALHRLRTRFRELIRAEVAATVRDPGDLPDELRHLVEIASAGR